jgi:hypothetical protein
MRRASAQVRRRRLGLIALLLLLAIGGSAVLLLWSNAGDPDPGKPDSGSAVAGRGAARPPVAGGETAFKHPSGWFGTNYWLAPKQLQNGDAALVEQTANAAERIGLRWVRAPIYWSLVELSPGTYDWDLTDDLVAILARSNLRFYPVMTGAPRWASPWPDTSVGSGCAQPDGGTRLPPAERSISDFAGFAAAAAQRYGRRGEFWAAHPELPALAVNTYEIWNEQNLTDWWCEGPNPELYADLFVAAQAELVAEQPAARVMVGGFASGLDGGFPETQFLARAIARQSTFRSADYVGAHGYGEQATDMMERVTNVRRALQENGMSAAKVVFNEWGWEGIPEADRAQRYRKTIYRLGTSRCSLAGIANFELVSGEDRLPYELGHRWGITNPLTGAMYPSARSYQDAIADLEGGRYRTSDVWNC